MPSNLIHTRLQSDSDWEWPWHCLCLWSAKWGYCRWVENGLRYVGTDDNGERIVWKDFLTSLKHMTGCGCRHSANNYCSQARSKWWEQSDSCLEKNKGSGGGKRTSEGRRPESTYWWSQGKHNTNPYVHSLTRFHLAKHRGEDCGIESISKKRAHLFQIITTLVNKVYQGFHFYNIL